VSASRRANRAIDIDSRVKGVEDIPEVVLTKVCRGIGRASPIISPAWQHEGLISMLQPW
jgi:hypothetical protein